MARPRSICFTLNNHTEEEVIKIQANIYNGSFKYIVYQQERGAAGTPHLQGYAQRPNPTTYATWKGLLSDRVHLEASKGTASQNRAYCVKDTDRIPGTLIIEKGEIPVPGERRDLTALCEAAKDPHRSVCSLIDEFGPDYLRYNRGISAIRASFSTPRDFKTRVFWFYGSTGSGKTRLMAEIAPSAYWKQNSPWWCGYDPMSHDDVCIDEFRGDFAKFSFLLSLFDRYPLQVQSKGGNCHFRARQLFITTPKSPQSTWESRTDEDLQQLHRRIDCVVEFFPGGIKRVHRGLPSDYALLGIVHAPGNAGPPPEGVTTEEDIEVEDSGRRIRARVETFNIQTFFIN